MRNVKKATANARLDDTISWEGQFRFRSMESKRLGFEVRMIRVSLQEYSTGHVRSCKRAARPGLREHFYKLVKLVSNNWLILGLSNNKISPPRSLKHRRLKLTTGGDIGNLNSLSPVSLPSVSRGSSVLENPGYPIHNIIGIGHSYARGPSIPLLGKRESRNSKISMRIWMYLLVVVVLMNGPSRSSQIGSSIQQTTYADSQKRLKTSVANGHEGT
ncbi:hypothetical protein K474DRAFT_1676149 [Panus rudis PR-1116 ss-1]|nr:hypothetical protein K474DRAFT_1676149 [Panus rudis PR-1116 ss-1]